MKKLFNWIWAKPKKQEAEPFFEVVWTPHDENTRKYEEIQAQHRAESARLIKKYGA